MPDSSIRYVTNISSIDETHDEYITIERHNLNQLEIKKKQLEKLLKSLNSLKLSKDYLKIRTNLLEECDVLKSEIQRIESYYNISDYLLKIGNTLVEYFNIDYSNLLYANKPENISGLVNNTQDEIINEDLDLKKASSSIKKIKKYPKKRNQHLIQNTFTIDDFLNTYMADNKIDNTNLTNNTEIDKSSLSTNYLTILNKQQFSNLNNHKFSNFVCNTCNADKLFHSDGYYVCPICGEFNQIYIENEMINIKDSSNNKQKYPYKRLNHLKEKLNQFQGKENFDIPDKVKQIIYNHLKAMNIDRSKITKNQIDKILHEHKLQSCYEHLTYIYCDITKNKSIEIDKITEDKLCLLFTQMQNSHDKHTPDSRLNSINYSFIINKLLIILGEHELAAQFPLLKNMEKLRNLDKIWEKICFDMGWEFESSF